MTVLIDIVCGLAIGYIAIAILLFLLSGDSHDAIRWPAVCFRSGWRPK